jgi:hypothetical protein
MVDMKRLKVLETKLSLLLDLASKIKDEVDFIRRSHYRDMKDKWQFSKDIGHPVTGDVTPEESAELLVMALCKRDRS